MHSTQNPKNFTFIFTPSRSPKSHRPASSRSMRLRSIASAAYLGAGAAAALQSSLAWVAQQPLHSSCGGGHHMRCCWRSPSAPLAMSSEGAGCGGGGTSSCVSRRGTLRSWAAAATAAATSPLPRPALAYDPDPDRLRESLYLLSRAQEATVQIQRIVKRSSDQEELRNILRLKLKLVQASYKILDQVNFSSQYIDPEELLAATEAGVRAVESLQDAVVYVQDDLGSGGGGAVTDEQRAYLAEACQSTREGLFEFLRYMPQEKLEQARKRVEKENADNREEFDSGIDKNAGVYNPVMLPWKEGFKI